MSDEFRRKRKLYKMYQYQLVIWLGTWIRTKIDGVRVRCFAVELSPTRWKAKFGRMDVSEARRGQGCTRRSNPPARRAPEKWENISAGRKSHGVTHANSILAASAPRPPRVVRRSTEI